MYLAIELLRRFFLRRRVIIHTIAGRVTYRRPKEYTVEAYRKLLNDWMAVDRPVQKLGDDNHGVVVKNEQIIAVEVY